MLNKESWETLSQSFEFDPRSQYVETLFAVCSDYVVDSGYISFRFAFQDRVRIQCAVDSLVAARVPFYFTVEQELFGSSRVIYEFRISDLFSFVFARFSGSCCASRSLSSRRPRKRKTPSKGKKHNNWREASVIVDHVF